MTWGLPEHVVEAAMQRHEQAQGFRLGEKPVEKVIASALWHADCIASCTTYDTEKITARVINDHERNMAENPDFCGLSVNRQITDALRAEGLLQEAT